MDIITTFIADTRDSVMVTYSVKVSATDIDDNPLFLRNGEITIQQEVFQDTNDWGDLLQSLLTYCNSTNPGDVDLDEALLRDTLIPIHIPLYQVLEE